MSKPQEKPADDPRRGGFGVLAWLVGSLLVVYALSTGPAMKLAEHNVISWNTVERAYAPLGWLIEDYRPTARLFTWYLEDLWDINFD